MFVKDSDGNSYNVSPTDKELSNPSLGMDGPILANSKKTAWVGFEVKQGAKGLQFEYQASMFGGKTAVIDLGMSLPAETLRILFAAVGGCDGRHPASLNITSSRSCFR